MSDRYTRIVHLDKFTHVVFVIDHVLYEMTKEECVEFIKSKCANVLKDKEYSGETQ